MKFPYNDLVLEHFKNPKNVGKIDDPDGKAMVGSPACGDMVAVYIKVDEATRIISDIKFESYGCASNIATASIITELAKGKTIEEAKKLNCGRMLRTPLEDSPRSRCTVPCWRSKGLGKPSPTMKRNMGW